MLIDSSRNSSLVQGYDVDIPALMLILVGSYFFFSWLQSRQPLKLWIAFCFAELAFLSRVTTSGVVLGWFAAAIVSGGHRRLFSKHVVAASSIYLTMNVAWVLFVRQFSTYEIVANRAFTRVPFFSLDNLFYYPSRLPSMTGWGILIAAFVGALVGRWSSDKQCSPFVFWGSLVLAFSILPTNAFSKRAEVLSICTARSCRVGLLHVRLPTLGFPSQGYRVVHYGDSSCCKFVQSCQYPSRCCWL